MAVSKTLFMTGGMSEETQRTRLMMGLQDSKLNSIHIVGQDFKADGFLTQTLSTLISNRPNWGKIQLSSCKGRIDRIVEIALSKSTVVRKLILSDSKVNGARFWLALSKGLKQNNTLLTLGLQDMQFENIDDTQILCDGLQQNASIIELLCCQSNFQNGSHLTFAKGLGRGIQHLSFQNCGLSDLQTAEIVECLKASKLLLELSLEGNECVSHGLNALANVLPESNLIVLDLSAQKTNQSLDLAGFSQAISQSKIRCLHLSDNSVARFSTGMDTGKLQILQLAWCQLPINTIEDLSISLINNKSRIRRLCLYECDIDNAGISKLASYLPQMNSLKKIDLGGKQKFDKKGVENLVLAMKDNLEIEQVLLPDANEQIEFYCDLNRAGRRFLKTSWSHPVSLWPLVLERIQTMELLATCDPYDRDIKDIENQKEFIRRRSSAVYSFLRSGSLVG